MLTFYLICLITGGTLVGASILFGGDADADVDTDVDFDADVDIDVDADVDVGGAVDMGGDVVAHPAVDVQDAMALATAGRDLPATRRIAPLSLLLSVRFWTFFLAFFGLAGVVLTLTGVIASSAAVTGASLALGGMSGYGSVMAFKMLQRGEVDSGTSSDRLLNSVGTLLLPVSPDRRGKVRVVAAGHTYDYIATTDEPSGIGVGTQVVIYEIDDGIARVAPLRDVIE